MRALENDMLRLKKTVVWQRFEMERIRTASGVPDPQPREARSENPQNPRGLRRPPSQPPATSNGTPVVMKRGGGADAKPAEATDTGSANGKLAAAMTQSAVQD